MELESRDPFDIPTTTGDRWVSIIFDRHNKSAILWASEQFGNDFFAFGSKFFFADEKLAVMFKLRWL